MMKKTILGTIIGIIIISLLGTTYYFYSKYQGISGKSADREIKQLVVEVGKIMMLPDEVPTLATVTDKSKLAGQKFFRNALDNDKVLIFSLASKAILYRPKEKRVIEVASVTMNDQSLVANVSPTGLPEKNVKKIGVVIYNGTSEIGLTTKYEGVLTDKFSDIVVLGKETAKDNSYQEALVVDITGQSAQIVKELASLLGGKVGIMPKGENPPISDILVILGKKNIK